MNVAIFITVLLCKLAINDDILIQVYSKWFSNKYCVITGNELLKYPAFNIKIAFRN